MARSNELDQTSQPEVIDDSSSSSPTVDPVVYPKLSTRISNYLQKESVQNRRRTLPYSTAPDGPDDANSPWDIKNVRQLIRWTEENPDLFLETLNELRKQRDLGIEACNHYDEFRRTQRQNYEEVVKEKAQLEQQLRQLREVTPSVSTYSGSAKRSQKLPDPPQLTDGIEPTWDDWHGKIQDKMASRLRAALSTQVVQPGSLTEIRNYLIRLNNEHRAMRELKEKESVKKQPTKQVTFAEDFPRPSYQKKPEVSMNPSKPRGAVLTSAKETDILDGNCFVCHKSGHTSNECPHRVPRINALDDDADEFDRSGSDSDSDSKN
jgi:hypothetical protein